MLTLPPSLQRSLWLKLAPVEEAGMESNQRYYARRAAEERMAAQRAMTAAARERHARLASQFAARAAAALQEVVSAA